MLNSTPYNFQDQDRNPYINRQGLQPSYRYKSSKIIWLNSSFASSSNSNGNTYFSFTFDLPPFQLYNRTKLSVVSYTSNESSAKAVIIKCSDLLVDNNSSHNVDNDAYPTLFVTHTGVASMLNNNKFSLSLLPQQITRITLYLSNNFSTRNAGFTITSNNGHFVLGLLFEDDDLIVDDASSIYK